MDMKLAVIAEFYDKVSKPLAKLAKAQKGFDKAAKAQRSGAAKAAASSRQAEQAMASEASAAGALKRSLNSLSGAYAKIARNRKALAASGRAHLGAGLGRVRTGIGRTAAVGAGLAVSTVAAAASIVGPAAEMEKFQVQLRSLEGSSEKAEAALEWAKEFAIKTPLQTEQVIEAYAQLKNFGLDPTNGSLQALVDTMAKNGKGYEALQGYIMAIGQAYTKQKLQGEEAMQLQERSVPVWDLLAKATGKNVVQLQELSSKGKLGRDAINKLLIVMGQEAAGASAAMASTWEGIVSNILQAWYDFRIMIADAGLFDLLKQELQSILNHINQMKEDGTLLNWAKQISETIQSGLRAIWAFGQNLMEVFRSLASGLSWVADLLGGWENLAMAIIALPLASTFISIAVGVMQVVKGVALLSAALLANPIILIITAIIAVIAGLVYAGYWLYQNWDKVIAWFASAWEWIKNAASDAWQVIKDFFNWSPDISALVTGFVQLHADAFLWLVDKVSNLGSEIVAALSAGWEEVKGFFSGAWNYVSEATEAAWAKLKAIIAAAWQSLPAPIREGLEAIGTLITSLWTGITDKAKAIWQDFASFLTGLWDSIVQPIKAGWDTLSGLFGDWISGNEEAANAVSEHQKALEKFSGTTANAVENLRALDAAQRNEVAFKANEGLASANLKAAASYEALGGVATAWFNWDEGIRLNQALEQGALSLADYQARLETVMQGGGDYADDAKAMLKESFNLAAAQREAAKYEQTLLNVKKAGEAAALVIKQEAKVIPMPAPRPASIEVREPASLERAGRLAAEVAQKVEAIKGVIASVNGMMSSLDWTFHGERLMETLAQGMRNKAAAVVAAVQSVTQEVRDHLPSSPAKVGPLSDLHRLKFMETIAGSIRPDPLVKAMGGAAAAGLAAFSLAGASPVLASPGEASYQSGAGKSASITVNFSPKITVHGSGEAGDIAEAVRALLPELVADIERALADKARLDF